MGFPPSDTCLPVRRPLVVLGSANADLCLDLDRLPLAGETVAGRPAGTLPGGKGANQAVAAARLSYPVQFICQLGNDKYAAMLEEALTSAGVGLEHVRHVAAPTGIAVVMKLPGGGRGAPLRSCLRFPLCDVTRRSPLHALSLPSLLLPLPPRYYYYYYYCCRRPKDDRPLFRSLGRTLPFFLREVYVFFGFVLVYFNGALGFCK